MENFYLYKEQAKYASGQADMCNTILELFDAELPKNLQVWLIERRHVKREEASDNLSKAIDAIKESEK